MDQRPRTTIPTIGLGNVLDRLGRLIGVVRFLERPDTRRAVERAVAAPVAGLAARIEATARDTEAGLVRTARSVRRQRRAVTDREPDECHPNPPKPWTRTRIAPDDR